MQMNDKRYSVIKSRLLLLSKEEIQRIVDNIDLVCFDTFNFDEESKKYCPLAIATNLHNTIKNPTNNLIQLELSKRFNPVNAIRGVEGTFYRSDRKNDLIKICKEVLCIK